MTEFRICNSPATSLRNIIAPEIWNTLQGLISAIEPLNNNSRPEMIKTVYKCNMQQNITNKIYLSHSICSYTSYTPILYKFRTHNRRNNGVKETLSRVPQFPAPHVTWLADRSTFSCGSQTKLVASQRSSSHAISAISLSRTHSKTDLHPPRWYSVGVFERPHHASHTVGS
jgi:hypothetical protein